MKLRISALLLGILLWAGIAEAKLFNFGSSKVAAYFAGAWAPPVDNTLTSKSDTVSATPITVNSQHPYTLSGEFGFLFGSDRTHFGFGLEVVHPKDLTDQSGTNS